MIRTSSKLCRSAVLAAMLALAVRDVEAGGRGFGGGSSARPSSNSGGSFGRGNSSPNRSTNSGFSNNNSGFRAARSNFGNNSGGTNYTANRPVNTVRQPVMNTYRSPVRAVANSTSSLPRTVLPTLNKTSTGLNSTVGSSSLGRRTVTSVPSLSRGTKSFASGSVNRGIASRFPKGLKTANAGTVKDSLLKKMTGSNSKMNSGLAGAKLDKNKAKAILAAGVAVGVLGEILNSDNSGDVVICDAEPTTFFDSTPFEQETIVTELPVISSEAVLASSTEVQTVPSEYTLLIFNMTEQPMTYSIRAEGTKWGTYTIEAGQHHRFTVPQDAMEVQYTNSAGVQMLSLPGEHVYAFSGIDGTVQLFNADPDEADTSAYQ